MQFTLLCLDGTDPEAPARRTAARTAHMALVEEAAKRGEFLAAAALKNDADTMIGSMMLVDFPSRAELDAWLVREPYILGNVWQKIDIYPCAIPPAFAHLLKK